MTIKQVRLDSAQILSSMDIPNIRKDPQLLFDSISKRKLESGKAHEFISEDVRWRQLKSEVDSIRQSKNKISLEMSKNKNDMMIEEAKGLNLKLSSITEELDKVEQHRNKLMLSLPNLLDSHVPLGVPTILGYLGTPKVRIGGSEEFRKDNPEIENIPFKNAKSQYDIIKEFDLVDEEVGSKLSGARFYYKKNELVNLSLALSLFGMRSLADKGFKQIAPPFLVKGYVEEMATTLDAFEETLYKIENEDLYLIPSAEHPIAAYNNNKVFTEKELPIKYVGFSTSFRKEAGAHGKETKGIYRNHHFDKVEQYILCTQSQAEKEMNDLISNQISMLRELNIPIKALIVPSWDMDKKATIQVDVEGWFPGQNKYGELGSHGHLGTWQSTRLNIKYLPNGKTEPVNLTTLYGTFAAVERTLACMLENSLNEDGIIEIPKVLRDLSGIDQIKPVTNQV